MNNTLLLILFAFFSCVPSMNAQSLTESEVTEKMNHAFELQKEGKASDALKLFLTVGENTKLQRTDAERQVYVISQTMACRCYESLKKYKEGYSLAKELLKGNLNEEERKSINRLYAINGYLYACVFLKHDENGHTNYSLGRKIISEILPYADEQIQNYALPRIPLSWYLEGMQYAMTQQYNDAFAAYKNALDGYRELQKPSEEASVLKEMAWTKRMLLDFDESKRLYSLAYSMAMQAGNAAKQLDILKEMWSLGNDMGNLELIRVATASIDSIIDIAGDAKTRFEYYLQKGNEEKAKDQYKLAERWYKKGQNVVEEQRQGTSVVDRYMVYTRLRDLYVAMGQYDNAILFGRKVIAESQKQMHPNEYGYYFSYGFLADIYKKIGNKKECFACIDTMFLDMSNTNEPKELSQLYLARARCYSAFKDYASALADYEKADEILKAKYSQSEENRVTLLALMGGMENRLKQYEESEKHYQLYAKYEKQLYGETSMEYVNAIIWLANAEGFSGNIDAGCSNYSEATGIMKSLMKENIPYMQTEEREVFWKPISALFLQMTPFALEAKMYQNSFTKDCYDALVLSKAFLLETERSLFDVVKKEGTKEDMHDYMSLSQMKRHLKQLEKDYTHNSDSILQISQRANRLAAHLSNRFRSFSNITGFIDIDYNTVRESLKTNEVMLDFTDFISESAGRKYAVYIINKVYEYPLVKYLFAERQIDSLGITRPDMYYDKAYASKVVNLLWTPLKEFVPEGSTVYYVPSQLLFQIALESLPMEGGTMLGDHYHFVRLSSARELTTLEPTLQLDLAEGNSNAVLYGGLQYDLEASDWVAEAGQYDVSSLLAVRGDILRGDSVYRPLPGSRKEVDAIENILKSNHLKVESYTGKRGTEESFLNMNGHAPQILHIATHSFYYTPEKAMQVDYLKGYSDAMLLSGIVFSGGNATWLGKPIPDGVLGGILTADDISRIDLSGAEMVVLSSCQSGQGKVTSEGLYGLQRAFKKAGVGTMVMAMWNISDSAATEFMTTFYKQLVSKECRWDKRKAFKQTKSIIREKYPDPFYWAAFVMLD